MDFKQEKLNELAQAISQGISVEKVLEKISELPNYDRLPAFIFRWLAANQKTLPQLKLPPLAPIGKQNYNVYRSSSGSFAVTVPKCWIAQHQVKCICWKLQAQTGFLVAVPIEPDKRYEF
jgi:hypothetical protein